MRHSMFSARVCACVVAVVAAAGCKSSTSQRGQAGASGSGAAGMSGASGATGGAAAGSGGAAAGAGGQAGAATGVAGSGVGGGGSGGGSPTGCPASPPVNFGDASVRLACGKLVYVAGGDNFHLIVSSDLGSTWKSYSPNDIAGDDYVNDITVANGFVMVNGLPGFYLSADGAQSFSRVETVSHNSFDSAGGEVAAGPGLLVLSDNQGTYTSKDGATWQSITPFPDGSHPSNFPGHFHGVATGGGKYVFFQDHGAVRVFDGTSWSQGVLVGSDHDAAAVAYGNGKFVVAGYVFAGSFTSFTATSTDGKTWGSVQTTDAAGTPLGEVPAGLVFDGTVFRGYWGSNKVGYTSPDGLKWTKVTLSHGIKAVAYLDSHFFGLDDKSLLTSSDGVTWTAVHTLTADETFAINGPRVALGYILK